MKDKREIIDLYQKKDTAKTFDEEREKFSYQRYKHLVEKQLLKKSIKSDQKVLDVACGTGRMALEVLNTNAEYFGVDTSPAMVHFLKEKTKNLANKKINVILADAEKLPFKDNTFDLTFSYHLLWHLPKETQTKIIQEMIRVTKPKGTIIFDILNRDFFWESIKNFWGIAPLAGIHKLSIKEIKSLIGERRYFLEKLSDAHIENAFFYKIFNIINLFRRVLPSRLFHMLYFKVKK